MSVQTGLGASLTVTDVCGMLGLSRNTVYKLARQGEIPSFKVGRQLRFREADIALVSTKQKASAPANAPSPETDPRPDVLDSLPAWMQGSLVIGGQDMACDVLANQLAGLGIIAVRSHENGYVSLSRMYLGTVHAAAIALWAGSENRYNIPYIKGMLPGQPVIVFRILKRRVGMSVPAGNPMCVKRWSDLLSPGTQLANRERGASTRVLLDEHLRLLEAAPLSIDGYATAYSSELGQALSIAQGKANLAITGEQVARQVQGLEFLPLQLETLDLVVAKTERTRPLIKALHALLKSPSFKRSFDPSLQDTSLMGEVVYET